MLRRIRSSSWFGHAVDNFVALESKCSVATQSVALRISAEKRACGHYLLDSRIVGPSELHERVLGKMALPKLERDTTRHRSTRQSVSTDRWVCKPTMNMLQGNTWGHRIAGRANDPRPEEGCAMPLQLHVAWALNPQSCNRCRNLDGSEAFTLSR